MSITIKEIADIAGVHRSTVDKVIHKRVGVSDQVRQRIQKIIDQYGYEPNPVGVALKRQEKPVVLAAILLKVDSLKMVREGIEKALGTYKGFNSKINYRIIPYPNIEKQLSALEEAISKKVDGIIINPIISKEVKDLIDKAVDIGIPVITSNTDIPESKRLCFVGQNGYKAGQVAGRLMSEFLGGKGDVACIISSHGMGSNELIDQREIGFLDFMASNFPDIRIVETIQSMEDPAVIYNKTLSLLKNKQNLEGIYITCGGVSEVGHALEALGLDREIKVISFEDYVEILELVRKDVINCTIDSNQTAQGYRPCRILMDYILYNREPGESNQYTDINILVKESL